MINIKLTNPYTPSSLFRQTPEGSGVWDGCRFFMNEDIEECDYWVVLDNLKKQESVKCPPENTILFELEASSIRAYKEAFARQFSTVVSCQGNIKHNTVINALTTVFWHVDKNYDELVQIEPFRKTKLISLITSDKQFTDGHKRRFEFAHQIKDYFGDDMDLFGRGVCDFDDKWDVLAPYKFSIAIENSWHPDWLTEKLTDCFLAYSFPLYYGCPNAEEYFDPRSFMRIDINDLDESKRMIENTIKNERFYQDNIEFLKNERDKYLNRYNIFPLIADFASRNFRANQRKVNIALKPEEQVGTGFGFVKKPFAHLKSCLKRKKRH